MLNPGLDLKLVEKYKYIYMLAFPEKLFKDFQTAVCLQIRLYSLDYSISEIQTIVCL